jgi:hypothetical protein
VVAMGDYTKQIVRFFLLQGVAGPSLTTASLQAHPCCF